MKQRMPFSPRSLSGSSTSGIKNMRKLVRHFIAVVATFIPAFVAAQPSPPPEVRREFRGAWVATVANIDWPSKKGLPVAKQKAELIALLDKAVELKLNAIVFQV